MLTPLPIDPHVPAIVDAARRHRAVVVVAPPGAGKTTRVPPALMALGRVALLQPRRIAARALARRIASEQGWTVGEEVGWHVRGSRAFGSRTRLLVMTEGLLTARLQDDPLLSDFGVVVLDEMHERSLHADLALAFARQAALARGDLHVVVMSATLDARAIASFLGGCPIIEVAGRPYPVEIEHAALTVTEAVRRVLARDGGHVLCFLPGVAEIRRASDGLAGVDALVLPLHGSLDADAQDAALAPTSRRKIVLATNVAETSLTVDGVTDVIDTGLAKVLQFDPARGLDRLAIESISQDSADQRAGRAGRTAPGRALRLWDARERLRPHREPEIHRVDLAGAVLDVLAWGGDPLTFEWLEPPAPARVESALALLELLGATRGRAVTPLGRALRRLPLPPRLARVLLAAGGSPRAAAACAILAERDFLRGIAQPTDSDVLARVDLIREAPASVREAARQLEAAAREASCGGAPADDDLALRRGILAGFPDRVARRRERGSPRLLLATGHGAVLDAACGVRNAEWLVAVNVTLGPRGPGSEALVRLASAVEREWLEPTGSVVCYLLDEAAGTVRATRQERYFELVLSETATRVDPEAARPLLVAELRRRGLGEENERFLRRARFAGVEIDVLALIESACTGQERLPALDLRLLVPFETRRDVDVHAPESLVVPSGREARLEYREDGEVVLAVKLQELFGLADTPRVGRERRAVTVMPLAPNGRPVQTTQDLRSFWERTYPEVRRELRGRYPRHPWPEDPWTAIPTARAKRRGE